MHKDVIKILKIKGIILFRKTKVKRKTGWIISSDTLLDDTRFRPGKKQLKKSTDNYKRVKHKEIKN